MLKLPRLDGNVLGESRRCCGEQDSDVDLGVHFERIGSDRDESGGEFVMKRWKGRMLSTYLYLRDVTAPS